MSWGLTPLEYSILRGSITTLGWPVATWCCMGTDPRIQNRKDPPFPPCGHPSLFLYPLENLLVLLLSLPVIRAATCYAWLWLPCFDIYPPDFIYKVCGTRLCPTISCPDFWVMKTRNIAFLTLALGHSISHNEQCLRTTMVTFST